MASGIIPTEMTYDHHDNKRPDIQGCMAARNEPANAQVIEKSRQSHPGRAMRIVFGARVLIAR
jgi:hypothetical protein